MLRACVARAGSHCVDDFPTVPPLKFMSPGVRPGGVFAGVRLNSMSAWLYSTSVDESRVDEIWSDCLKAAASAESLSDALTRITAVTDDILPGFAFVDTCGVLGILSQVLQILAWSGGSLKVSPVFVELVRVGRPRIGVSQRGGWQGSKFWPFPSKGSDQVAMTVSLPSHVYALPSTSALFVHVTRILPSAEARLSSVFAIAVTAGVPSQEILTSAFGMPPARQPLSAFGENWDEAETLVTRTRMNPLIKLRNLISDDIGAVAFRNYFGNLSAPHSTAYPHSQRAGHLRSLTYIRRGYVDPTESAQATRLATDAANVLIELQNSIGRL